MEDVWLFNFALEKRGGKKLVESKANELLDLITLWSEENGFQIGGGYRAQDPGEFDGDIFKLK